MPNKWLVIGLIGGVLVGGIVWSGMWFCNTGNGWSFCISQNYNVVAKQWGDVAGRTVVYENRSNSFFNKAGYLHAGYTNVPWGVVGYFDRFEKIAGSDDEDIYVKDDRGKVVLKGRVNLSFGDLGTELMLDKLLDSSKTPYELITPKINTLVSKSSIKKLFVSGDVVSVVVHPDDLLKIQSQPTVEVRGIRILLRRYYSMRELMKELL